MKKQDKKQQQAGDIFQKLFNTVFNDSSKGVSEDILKEAEKVFNVKRDDIKDAAILKDLAPDLYDEVWQGRKTLLDAKEEFIKRMEKKFGNDFLESLINDFDFEDFGLEPKRRKSKRRKKTQDLIDHAGDILGQENPMTLRQLFYRLVSKQVIPNTRAAYVRLSRVMTEARNKNEINFGWIVDRSKPEYIPNVWDNPEEYVERVGNSYRKDRWKDQPCYVEIWLEKDSLSGSIEPVTRQYGITLRAHRGYSSTTKKHDLANEFSFIDKPIYIFYIGDHDSSGLDIERDLKEKLVEYGAVDFEIIRLAILQEDIKKFNLPPLRVKESDPRTKRFKKTHGTEVIEADALPPSELRRRIEEAIRNEIEWETWNRSEKVEKVEMESITALVNKFKDIKEGNVQVENTTNP